MARILKKACRARDPGGRILPNVFGDFRLGRCDVSYPLRSQSAKLGSGQVKGFNRLYKGHNLPLVDRLAWRLV